jgi:hypothetical protein
MLDQVEFDQIVLDLGNDYGEITVAGISTLHDEGLVEAGLGDTVQAVKIKLEEVLRGPLTGIGIALRKALPRADMLDSTEYQLDTFTAEFQFGLAQDTGVSAGVVAKIIPSGSFTCTYTWKRKS